jgi:hypothetical protein
MPENRLRRRRFRRAGGPGERHQDYGSIHDGHGGETEMTGHCNPFPEKEGRTCRPALFDLHVSDSGWSQFMVAI